MGVFTGSSGVRIDLLEVEACLAAHPQVVAAAAKVVSPAGPRRGEPRPNSFLKFTHLSSADCRLDNLAALMCSYPFPRTEKVKHPLYPGW